MVLREKMISNALFLEKVLQWKIMAGIAEEPLAVNCAYTHMHHCWREMLENFS